MSKLRLFIENFFIYGLGGIISKLVPLIMVPIVTRLMPDSSYYGISDLSNTVIQFGSAFAIMGMYDAMYRMFFEKEDREYRKDVCSTALLFTIATSITVFIAMLLMKNVIARYFFGSEQYTYVVYLSAVAMLAGATNSIISAPTRMQNKRKIFFITNTISPILSYTIAILMLLAGHYVIALPLAAAATGIVIGIVFGILNYTWFQLSRFNWNLLKQLCMIAIPLFPNFLIYWVFNSSDKIMITNMIGVGAAGIYSVGSKLGHCSQLIYTAFAGGWQYFAFSTMKEENQVATNSMVFEYLGIISFIATAFVCAWSYPIFQAIFTEEYVRGYMVAPYLFLAPLLQMLFQIACNQFLVIKKTWPNMLILSVSAGFNVLLNFKLIPIMGIEGAAIATLMGYLISVAICVIVLCRMKLMVISARFIVSAVIMAAGVMLWRGMEIHTVALKTIVAFCIAIVYCHLYRKDIKILFLAIKESSG